MIAARVKAPATRSPDPIQASPLALQPELLQAFLRLYGTLWSHGELDQATKEIARIRNARTIDCPICKAIRFAGAREEGLDEDVLERVRDGFEQSDLSPRQKVVLRYVDGCSFAEIAERLRMSKNGVFARHERALEELRAVLDRGRGGRRP